MKYKEIAYIITCLIFLILAILSGFHIANVKGWTSADYLVALLLTGMLIQVLKD